MQASRFIQLVKAAQAYYPAVPQQQYVSVAPQSSNLLKQADVIEKRAEEAAQANLLAQLQDLLVKNPKVVAGLLGGTLGAGAGALVPSTDEMTGETHRGRNALLGALLGAGAGVGSSYIPGADNAISTALQGQNPFAAKTANYNPYMLKQADLLDDAKKLIAENPQVALGLLGGAAGGGVGALIPSEHRLRNALIGMGLGGAAGAGAGFIPQVQDYLKENLLPPPPPPPPTPKPKPAPVPVPIPEPEDEGLSTGAKVGIGGGAGALALLGLVLGRGKLMEAGAKGLKSSNGLVHFLGRRSRALGKTTDKVVEWLKGKGGAAGDALKGAYNSSKDKITDIFSKGKKAAK